MGDEGQIVLLGDVVDLLTGHPFRSEQYCSDPSAPKLLRGDNVGQGFLRWDGVQRWPKNASEDLHDYWLQPDDVILAMDRPWIEAGLKYASVRESDLPSLLVQRVSRLRGTSKLDTKFLKYVIGSQAFTDYILAVQTGTAVPHISSDQIKGFEFCLPLLPTQHAIASILGSLDDKIELNRQMNETLEAMARAIFQSWFVDFDPVRAKAGGRDTGLPPEVATLFPSEFEEVDGREVPKGWKIGIAEDFCETISDGSHYSPKEIEDGPCIIGTVKDMDNFDFDLKSCKRITIEDYEKLCINDCKPMRGDVLLSKDGTMGKPHFCEGHQDLVILSSIAIFRPKKEIYSHYLYWFLKSEQFQSNLSMYSSGSVLTRMVCRDLKKIEILLPDENILQEFLSLVKVLHMQIIQNCEQSRTLAQIRDTLLPKLMSGDIHL
jgi:type I restriction enzyme S subunit